MNPRGAIERLDEWRRRALAGRRRPIIVAVAGILLAATSVGLIGKAANYAKLGHTLEHADKRWFLVCLGGEALAYIGYMAAYRDIARVDGGPRLSFWLTARIVAASFGAMVVATGVGALAVDYWALRRAGASRHRAIARVLGLGTLEWAVLGAAASFSCLALLLGAGHAPLGMTLPWVIVVPLCYAGAVWVSSPRRRERLTDPGRGGKIRQAFADAVLGVVFVRKVITAPVRERGGGLLGTAVYWFGDIVCLWAGLKAFGVSLSTPELIAGYATGYVSTALPLPAAGAGGVDAAMTYALTLVGVPLAPALLGTFAYRIFNFWLPIIPALAVVPFLKQVREELPDVAVPAVEASK
ncbi:MAG: lysylphosphatidylglycerol synthase transmembrane domain-containing protein [Gaiellaceae bacterium]